MKVLLQNIISEASQLEHVEDNKNLRFIKTLISIRFGVRISDLVLVINQRHYNAKDGDTIMISTLINIDEVLLVQFASIKLLKQHLLNKENITKNLIDATEELPETFASVNMLYVPIKINGYSILAFVDSGAQVTIMSKTFAKKCGANHLIDQRYYGIARGIGKDRIIGKIHLLNITCEMAEIPLSFVVVENGTLPIILGLDVLRRYRCCIDLTHNCLIFNNTVTVTFADDNEIDLFTSNYSENTLAI